MSVVAGSYCVFIYGVYNVRTTLYNDTKHILFIIKHSELSESNLITFSILSSSTDNPLSCSCKHTLKCFPSMIHHFQLCMSDLELSHCWFQLNLTLVREWLSNPGLWKPEDAVIPKASDNYFTVQTFESFFFSICQIFKVVQIGNFQRKVIKLTSNVWLWSYSYK